MKTFTALIALKNRLTIFHYVNGKIGLRCPPIACIDCVFGDVHNPQGCAINHDAYIDREQLAELTISHPEFFI